MHANFVMKKNIIIYFLLVAWFKHGFSQTPKPIFSLADSSINVYFGANLKTTMLLTNRRPAPSTGTAYLLLPKDATGVEGPFDINARASTIYLAGYHCNPKDPLPFFGLASQKNSINVYHMGMYARQDLYDWFVAEYPKHVKAKLDMGKSCIRFKKPEHIPLELIGELLQKMSVQDWIALYEKEIKKG